MIKETYNYDTPTKIKYLLVAYLTETISAKDFVEITMERPISYETSEIDGYLLEHLLSLKFATSALQRTVSAPMLGTGRLSEDEFNKYEKDLKSLINPLSTELDAYISYSEEAIIDAINTFYE